MAVRSHTLTRPILRVNYNQRVEELGKHKPRWCMVISGGLMVVGISVPFLMIIGFLPATLLLAFTSLVLTGAGGITRLIFCGEIS